MKNIENVIKRLESLEARVAILEGNPSEIKITPKLKGKRSLTDYILELRGEEFFKQPRIANEVQEKLSDVYHCEVDRVSMCLLRLAEKKQLRKASKKIDKKDYLAYTW